MPERPSAIPAVLRRPLVEVLASWIDPLDALEAARGHRHPVLLLSGLRGHPASRFSILACDPARVLRLRAGETMLSGPVAPGEVDRGLRAGDPFELLRSFAPAGAVAAVDGLPFAGGAIGCLGYGLRRAVEHLPAAPCDPLDQPDVWLGLYGAAAVFDSREHRVSLVATGMGAPDDRNVDDEARRQIRRLRELLEKARRLAPPAERPATRRQAELRTSRDEYLHRIARALDYIAAGDIYQVNLSHRIECPFDGDPIDLFRRLSEINPAPFAAFVDAGSFQIVSASPERFLALEGRRARSSPIKGTRPRGASPDEDKRLARDLLESSKERAENVMIADLVRNDLGRVSEPGSVRVASLCALESFATVHHLVSTVEGRLATGRDRIDLLRALFPGGSMTGAPKVRAMEVIDELEGEERGIYSGSIGYLSLDGGIDFNIVIRSILCCEGRAHLRVGGGIVADSDPAREFRETLDKARALLQALEAELKI